MISHGFADKLAFSTGESAGTDLDTIARMVPGCETVERACETDDRAGVDYWAQLFGGRQLAIDAKTRKPGCSRWWQNGEPELALERYSVMPENKPPAGVIGWTLDATKKTDLVLYTFPPEDTRTCYLVGFHHLRFAFLRHGTEWSTRYKYALEESHRGTEHWQSKAMFVPAGVVLGAIQAVSVATATEPEPEESEDPEKEAYVAAAFTDPPDKLRDTFAHWKADL